jgi:hypothetical protein
VTPIAASKSIGAAAALAGAAAALVFAAACAQEPAPAAGATGASAAAPPARDVAYTEVREPCSDRDPRRQAYFGDLHVHTGLSMDAWTGETRLQPSDAYRFAKGEAVTLSGGRRAQLERALDFAAVTDHSEWLGEVWLCTDSTSPQYASELCRMYRGEIATTGGRGARMGLLSDRAGPVKTIRNFPVGAPARSQALCAGAAGIGCGEATSRVWRQIQAAAEAAYDKSSACRFTTFTAYEYSWTPELSKIHRNVIFRNDKVPALPLSWIDAKHPEELWQGLQRDCLDAGTGCDVLAIPHNSNLSNGRMFDLEYRDRSLRAQKRYARLRSRLEPLVEIMQIKGDSECANGLDGVAGRDELCSFEKFRPASTPDCKGGTGIGALAGQGCTGRQDFVRYALVEGLRERARIGVNPFQLGFVASTDTHNGTPGDTAEASYDGAHGAAETDAQHRLSLEGEIVPPVRANPGGLVGIWSEENSRDALFDAMRRRETFATSGVRIAPRLFAAWDFPRGQGGMCKRPDQLEQAFAHGVPMGAELPPRPAGFEKGPVFFLSALRDPDGNLLQRLQVVKAYPGADGQIHQEVHDVVGTLSDDVGVDARTCESTGAGSDSLCKVWRDPAFDPAVPAVYYLRALENPSCRWSARQCLALPPAKRPKACTDPSVPTLIQERAWTSPVWYLPEGIGA